MNVQLDHKVSIDTIEALFGDSFVGVTIHRGFKILYANRKVASILGYKNPSELLAVGSLKRHIPRRRQREIAARWAAIERSEITPERTRVTNINCQGQEVWIDVTDERIVLEDGGVAIMSILNDASIAVRTNESLLSSLRHLEVSLDTILESIPTGIAIFSETGEPKTVNSMMRLMFQASPEQNDYVPKAMQELLANLVNSDHSELSVRGVNTRMNKTVDLIARRMSDDAIMLCAMDVSDWKNIQDELKTLAERDPLTNLFNRRGFSDTVRPMIRTCTDKEEKFALIMVDIDHFKEINDKYGHEAGDKALKTFSKRLTATTRNRDIVGRMGGEEFAVFLPDSDLGTAQSIAERLREKIAADPIRLFHQTVPMTASFGLKVWEGKESDGQAQPRLRHLLQEADNALYRAKQLGRNRVELA